jgi:hypothetical protein
MNQCTETIQKNIKYKNYCWKSNNYLGKNRVKYNITIAILKKKQLYSVDKLLLLHIPIEIFFFNKFV